MARRRGRGGRLGARDARRHADERGRRGGVRLAARLGAADAPVPRGSARRSTRRSRSASGSRSRSRRTPSRSSRSRTRACTRPVGAALGLVAATLFACWPFLTGLLGGSRAWQNGTWQTDVGLHLYTEPLSTALVAVALALLLRPGQAPLPLALAGTALGFATVVKLSNGLLAGARVADPARRARVAADAAARGAAAVWAPVAIVVLPARATRPTTCPTTCSRSTTSARAGPTRCSGGRRCCSIVLPLAVVGALVLPRDLRLGGARRVHARERRLLLAVLLHGAAPALPVREPPLAVRADRGGRRCAGGIEGASSPSGNPCRRRPALASQPPHEGGDDATRTGARGRGRGRPDPRRSCRHPDVERRPSAGSPTRSSATPPTATPSSAVPAARRGDQRRPGRRARRCTSATSRTGAASAPTSTSPRSAATSTRSATGSCSRPGDNEWTDCHRAGRRRLRPDRAAREAASGLLPASEAEPRDAPEDARHAGRRTASSRTGCGRRRRSSSRSST